MCSRLALLMVIVVACAPAMTASSARAAPRPPHDACVPLLHFSEGTTACYPASHIAATERQFSLRPLSLVAIVSRTAHLELRQVLVISLRPGRARAVSALALAYLFTAVGHVPGLSCATRRGPRYLLVVETTQATAVRLFAGTCGAPWRVTFVMHHLSVLVASNAGGAIVQRVRASLGAAVPIVSGRATSGHSVTNVTVVPTVGAPRTLTVSDDGGTLRLAVGERFLLALGGGYQWTVTVDPAAVIALVNDGGPLAHGAQGTYVAQEAGQTTLTAVGSPLCHATTPPCEMVSRLFHVRVVVTARMGTPSLPTSTEPAPAAAAATSTPTVAVAAPSPTDGTGSTTTSGVGTPVVITVVAIGSPPISITTPTPARRGAVTLDDDGRAIHLRVGERFVLVLGNVYTWTVVVADLSIVGPALDSAPIPQGVQGVYVAKQAGETTLTAAGDPACRASHPACGMPSRSFSIMLIVS